MPKKEQTKVSSKDKCEKSATKIKRKSIRQNNINRRNTIQRLIYAIKYHISFPWKSRSEFRYNTDTLHPQYVFNYEDKKYTSVGITHEPKTFNRKNMPLQKNPKQGDNRPAYIRNGIVNGGYMAYGKKRTIKSMGFSAVDKANVKSKIRNYKNRQRKVGKKSKKKGK